MSILLVQRSSKVSCTKVCTIVRTYCPVLLILFHLKRILRNVYRTHIGQNFVFLFWQPIWNSDKTCLHCIFAHVQLAVGWLSSQNWQQLSILKLMVMDVDCGIIEHHNWFILWSFTWEIVISLLVQGISKNKTIKWTLKEKINKRMLNCPLFVLKATVDYRVWV